MQNIAWYILMKFEYHKVFKTNQMHAKLFNERNSSLDFPFANKFVAFVHFVHRMKAIAAQVFYLFIYFHLFFLRVQLAKRALGSCKLIILINQLIRQTCFARRGDFQSEIKAK